MEDKMLKQEKYPTPKTGRRSRYEIHNISLGTIKGQNPKVKPLDMTDSVTWCKRVKKATG